MGEVGFGNFLELRLCLLRFFVKASQGNTQPLAAVAAVRDGVDLRTFVGINNPIYLV